jgi:Ca2+-binding EF-hand superfamily protein
LSEEELFFVFKYLDWRRQGVITREDLLERVRLGKENESGGEDGNAVDAFVSFVKALKAAFHYTEEEKIKLGISEEYLDQFFGRVDK